MIDDEPKLLKSMRPAKKSRRSGGECSSGGGGGGSWEGLSPEILALSLVQIPPEELARAVSFVCKSWRDVVTGPYCWVEIDIERWCRRCNNPDSIEQAVKKLVAYSNGTCRRLSVYRLSNPAFCFAVNCLKGLRVLQVPMSDVTDRIIRRHVDSLKLLTFLDISYCLKLTCKGLEALGKHCTSLVRLKRNMPPPEWQSVIGRVAPKKDEGEALVIADTMPGLRHLELGYGCFTDIGLDAILTNCKNLSHLDIIGSNGVNLGGDLERKCSRLVVFRPPWYGEYQDADALYSSDEGEEYFPNTYSDLDDP